jgi:hypothetical protein
MDDSENREDIKLEDVQEIYAGCIYFLHTSGKTEKNSKRTQQEAYHFYFRYTTLIGIPIVSCTNENTESDFKSEGINSF